jgi:hypothetical protein
MPTNRERFDKLEAELTDAWEGQGDRKRITFHRWVKEMADNDRGTLQDAAKEYLRLRKLMS